MKEKNHSDNTYMRELTPAKIVAELNKYIIGQEDAKRCVAIALRNRWRRQNLPPELRDEVAPKNIMLIGPTGVGKTEISRRLATLVKAPFLKVEATRYTEVGYHGRDVESMVRDLVEVSINLVKAEEMKKVQQKAEELVETRILNALIPRPKTKTNEPEQEERFIATQEKFREKLRNGHLEDKFIEVKVEEKTFQTMQVFSGSSFEEFGFDMQTVLGGMFPPRMVTKKMTVKDARRIMLYQESENLIDKEKTIREGVSRAENLGIIFVDEIDKICAKEYTHGPDVSREGVQRDLLPIVEGSTVMTRYGPVRSDHILFIAAGAFHNSRPSDLIPELQGRFPIRVELKSLTKDDFLKILIEPKNAIVKQYTALMETEGLKLEFRREALEKVAEIAFKVNESLQDIGARRLHTVMENVIENISFNAPDMNEKKFVISKDYVEEKLKDIIKDENLTKYIL